MGLAYAVSHAYVRLGICGGSDLLDCGPCELCAAPAPHILSASHWFEMIGVDAGWHATEVVELQAFGDGSEPMLVVGAMR